MRKIICQVSIFAFLPTLFLMGCIHRIELTNFQTGQVLQGQYNEADRTITVTMPDGEVLKGKYSAVSNASFTFGTATTSTPGFFPATTWGYGFTSGGRGEAWALLKSETTRLMMEMIVTYSESTGHGFGEARTNDGRIFKVQF